MSTATMTRGLLLAALWLFLPYHAEARIQALRVVVFGDVHGAYDELSGLLVDTGVVDADLHWQAGTTHLVSLGDLLDRGPDSRKVIDLLRRLQGEATAAGGHVHVILGNHEEMNLTGDLRYVSPAERAAFADLQPAAAGAEDDPFAGLRAAYAADGPYGAWLIDRPAALIINDTAFVHGGLSPLLERTDADGVSREMQSKLREMLALRARLESAGVLPRAMEVNEAAARLDEVLAPPPVDAVATAEPDEGRLTLPDASALSEDVVAAMKRFVELARDPLFGPRGPLWYRGNAYCNPLLEQDALSAVLDAWQVTRVVMGHTPTADHRVWSRFGGRAILADTGMLASYYHGRAAAVVLDDDGIVVHYADEHGPTKPVADDDGVLFPLAESAVMTALRSFAPGQDAAQWQPLTLPGGGTVNARFVERSSRERKAELAALRVDRLLGLNLVLPVAEREVGGARGIAVAAWPSAVSETVRAAREPPDGPMPCASGSVYDLMYAFDALIGNEGRSSDSMIYDPWGWRLGSTDHGNSFGRSKSLPAYLDALSAPRLPAALADRMRSLDEQGLRRELGDLVGSRQIRALLARRDKLLEIWAVEG